MIAEKSNNDLLEQCKNDPNLKLIKKKKMGRSFGVLRGAVLYVFMNEKTREVMYLGDKLTDEQLPIFKELLENSMEIHPTFTMKKGMYYNG